MKKILPIFVLLFAFPSFGQVYKRPCDTGDGKCQNNNAFITSEIANLRDKPNQTAKIIKVLKAGDIIKTFSKTSQTGWFYVEVQKMKGWLHGNTFAFSDNQQPEPLSPGAGWVYLDKNPTDTGVTIYYKSSSVKYTSLGDVELWSKLIPNNLAVYSKKSKLPKKYAYAVMFVTLHCEARRMSMESFNFYDKNNNLIDSTNSFLAQKYREPIVPDSVGEAAWKKFCN
jgi:hypothetical protein